MKAYYYLLFTLALPFCVQGQDYYYPEKTAAGKCELQKHLTLIQNT